MNDNDYAALLEEFRIMTPSRRMARIREMTDDELLQVMRVLDELAFPNPLKELRERSADDPPAFSRNQEPK